jgi:hypothetical protein
MMDGSKISLAYSRAVTYSRHMAKKKNPAAVALGRLGGLKGGPARAQKLTKKELSEQGRNAVNARWAKIKGSKSA